MEIGIIPIGVELPQCSTFFPTKQPCIMAGNNSSDFLIRTILSVSTNRLKQEVYHQLKNNRAYRGTGQLR